MPGWFDKARSMWQSRLTPRYDLIWDAIRVPVAFLVAPLGAPLIVGLLSSPVLFANPEVFAIVVGVTGAFAYLITLLFGLPLFLILRKGRWTSFWIAPIAGCIVPFVALLDFFGQSGAL